MDGIAPLGVGAVAGRIAFTASAQPAVASDPRELSGDPAISALKLIQSTVANSPGPEPALDVRA